MLYQKQKLIKLTWLFPLFLALYEIATYLSNDAYLPALPHIARDLNTSNQLVQLTLTTWFMGSASMQLLLGPVCDRIGRRPILLGGGLIYIAASIGCALSHNIYLLLVLRFLQGATITSMIVAGYASVHELYNRERAIHIIAMITSITVLAPSLGPLFGALIMYFTDWRWIFIILALWACAAIIGLYFKMPETRSDNPAKIQFKSVIKHYKNLISNKAFVLFALTSGSIFAAMIAWIAAGPFLLINRFHFSTLDYALVQALVFSCFIIGTTLVRLLIKYFRLIKLIMTGLSIALIGGMVALLSSLTWPTALWNTVIALMFIAGGSGLAFPIISRLTIESSEEPMGSRVAISSCLVGISGILGSAIISGLYNGTLISLGIILFLFTAAAILFHVLNRNYSASA